MASHFIPVIAVSLALVFASVTPTTRAGYPTLQQQQPRTNVENAEVEEEILNLPVVVYSPA